VIEKLIGAAANTRAKDSEDRPMVDFLELNKALSSSDREEIRGELTSAGSSHSNSKTP
jgi:hypothetical protein